MLNVFLHASLCIRAALLLLDIPLLLGIIKHTFDTSATPSLNSFIAS